MTDSTTTFDLSTVGIPEHLNAGFREFFDALVEHPGDVAIWNAAADWCAEQGLEILAVALKMQADFYTKYPNVAIGKKSSPRQAYVSIMCGFIWASLSHYPRPYQVGMQVVKCWPKSGEVRYDIVKVNKYSVRLKRQDGILDLSDFNVKIKTTKRESSDQRLAIPLVNHWFYLEGGYELL